MRWMINPAGVAGAAKTVRSGRGSRQSVDAAVERATAEGVEAKGHVIDLGAGEDVAAAVARFAYDHRVNVNFVGSHGRTGMLAVMLGSNAEKIVKVARARCV